MKKQLIVWTNLILICVHTLADLILVMSNNQKKHLEQTWSFAKGKVFRLGHWQNQNVPDPYQHDQAFFDETCRNIQKYVSDWQSHF